MEAFLREQISFTAISDMIEAALNHCEVGKADSIEGILQADSLARRFVQGKLKA